MLAGVRAKLRRTAADSARITGTRSAALGSARAHFGLRFGRRSAWQEFSAYWHFRLSTKFLNRATVIYEQKRWIAADPQTVLDHFEKLLSLETDCWDVHAVLAPGAPGPEVKKMIGGAEGWKVEGFALEKGAEVP
jgi:hypothetical protein